MDFQQILNKRKSVRSFKPKPVSKTILKQLIVDASKAPSAHNLQPWKFYIVTKPININKLKTLLKQSLKIFQNEFNKLPKKVKNTALNFYSTMGDCQTIILVYYEKTKKDNLPYEVNLLSIASAVENLILSASNKGLGTCWVGSFKSFEKEINSFLKTKPNETLISGVLIGYPKTNFKPLNRKKKSLNQILKFV